MTEDEKDDLSADLLLERFGLHFARAGPPNDIPTPPSTPQQLPIPQSDNSSTLDINSTQQDDNTGAANLTGVLHTDQTQTTHGVQPIPILTLTPAPTMSSSPIRALIPLGAGRGVIVSPRRESQVGDQAQYNITIRDTPAMREADTEHVKSRSPDGIKVHENDPPSGQDTD